MSSNIGLPNESATPGVVSGEDYPVWKANFGSIAGVELRMMTGVVEYRTGIAPMVVKGSVVLDLP